MKNNAAIAMVNAKISLDDLISDNGEVPCTFLHGKHEIKGELLETKDNVNSPVVRVRSHTGKEYWILITLLMSIEGVTEI